MKATLDLGRDDVFKVDVKNSFSFFNTESEHLDLVMETFNDFPLDGRFINVEISSKQEGRERNRKKKKDSPAKKNRIAFSENHSNEKKSRKTKNRKEKTSQVFEKVFSKRKRRK